MHDSFLPADILCERVHDWDGFPEVVLVFLAIDRSFYLFELPKVVLLYLLFISFPG